MTMAGPAREARLRTTVEDLCDVLDRMRTLHERLLVLLSEKEQALVEVRLEQLEALRGREEELLRDVIAEEKERLLVTEEIGDLLDHDHPVTITVSEILPHLPDPLASGLTARRERLREVALTLARQNAVNRALIEHSVGHVQMFLSKLVHEQAGGPHYTRKGATPEDGGGTLFMDRRA